MKTIAFYQTKIFGNEAFTIRYYATVKGIDVVKRKELFPFVENDGKAENDYYKLILSELKTLPSPIPSLRNRRIVFIPTTESKLFSAPEINFLFNDSPLEDALLFQLNSLNISVERNYFVKNRGSHYNLDSVVFCRYRNIDIECDGNTFHLHKEAVLRDKKKTNELQSEGWTVLRFNYQDIIDRRDETCGLILETIRQCGGLIGKVG